MRIFLTFLFFCFSLSICAQKHNYGKPFNTYLEDSLVIIKAGLTYDSSKFVLYSNNCASENKHIVYTLGTVKQKPTLYRWTFLYDYFGVGLYNRKLSVKKTKPRQALVMDFENLKEQHNFSELNSDSLNDSSFFENGQAKIYFIRGCLEKFVLVNQQRDKTTIEARGVDDLQSKLYSQQRNAFIKIRNAFIKLIE